MAAEKPIIRIAVPGETAEDFMQAAAKQFRGDFFVAIDQPVGKHVRIEAPFLQGGVAVRGDAIAMPAVRNGRKGLVIRLVKLDSDSLGIPIPEASKQLALTDDAEESAVDEFEPQPTMASNVSAAVAQSIRSSGNAAPVASRQPAPSPAPKPAAKPAPKLEDLDDETREAVNEFGAQATRASEVSADLAKQLAEPKPDKAPVATAAHAVRRVTPESGVPKQPKTTPGGSVPLTKEASTTPPATTDDDAAFDSAFTDEGAAAPVSVHDKATAEMPPQPKPEPEELEATEPAASDDESASDEPEEALPERAAPENLAVDPKPAGMPRQTILLVVLLLAAAAAAAIYFLK